MIRTAVLTACLAGIISSVVGTAAIGQSGKRSMKLIVNMIVLLALVRPLLSFGHDDAVSWFEDFEPAEESSAGDILESFDLRSAELSVRLETEKLLRDNGFEFEKIGITCTYDEYDVIVISGVEITVKSAETADRLKAFTDWNFINTNVSIRVAEDNAQNEDQNAESPHLQQ